MKASKLVAVLLSTAALCCGATFGSSVIAAPDAPQARSGDPGRMADKPAAPMPAPVANTATAENVVVTSGTTTLRIKRVEVAGSTLTAADMTSLFGTKDAKVLEGRLRKLDAASIVVPEILVDSIDGGREMHLTQKDVLLANVHGGRAATGSAAAATLAFKDDKNDTRVSTGATTFEGLDLAQIVHIAAGPRTDEGEVPQPVCDEVAVQTVTIGAAVDNGPPVVAATIRATGLKGRALAADPGKTKQDATVVDDLAHSFAAELIEADDFALAGPADSSTKGPKNFALKHVAVHGFGDGKLARFELRGLALEGNDKQPGRLALASAEIENVATNASPVPSIDRIDLHDLAVDVPANEGSGGRIALSVQHAGYEAPGLVIGKLPAKAVLSIEHATFDVPPDSGAAPMLLAMGYKHLDLSSESRSRYDPAGQTLDIDRLSVTGTGMGTLDIKLGLAKVSEGVVSQVDVVQKAAAAAVLVKSLDLTLRNDGLIDKAIGFKAAIDGVSVEQERTNLGQVIDLGLLGLGLGDSAKAQRVAAALQKFIADPKTLHIALSSKDGLGADSLPLIGSPQALLDAVEIEAGADE